MNMKTAEIDKKLSEIKHTLTEPDEDGNIYATDECAKRALTKIFELRKSLMHESYATNRTEEFIPYQKCPICDGTKMQPGYQDSMLGFVSIPCKCQTCNGEGIIPMLKSAAGENESLVKGAHEFIKWWNKKNMPLDGGTLIDEHFTIEFKRYLTSTQNAKGGGE